MTCSDDKRIRRAAIVVSELRPGGMERVVVHVARSLKARGIAVEVICIRRRGPLAAELDVAGVPVAELGSLRGYDVRAMFR